MNYLRKKLQGIMTCSDFEGYLRTVSGAPPLTLPYSLGKDITSLTLTGNAVSAFKHLANDGHIRQPGQPAQAGALLLKGIAAVVLRRRAAVNDYSVFLPHVLSPHYTAPTKR